MSSFYYDLIKEINSVRTNPTAYADKLLEYKKYFQGQVLKLPGAKTGIKTEEGFPPYEEAAKFLKSMKPVEQMSPSKGLGRIANEYLESIKDLDPEQIGDIDIDLIIKKYGSFSGSFSNISDFGNNTPEFCLIGLLVCDGDESRSNRDFILDVKLKKVGIAREKHEIYGYLTIIVSCSEFKNTFDKDDNEENWDLITKNDNTSVNLEKKAEKEISSNDENNINCLQISKKMISNKEEMEEEYNDDIENNYYLEEEITKKKCSLIDHEEINAIIYCQECKIYMCNKCNNHHSQLFKNHKQYNLDNNIINSQIYAKKTIII